jgi:hypothetical protein
MRDDRARVSLGACTARASEHWTERPGPSNRGRPGGLSRMAIGWFGAPTPAGRGRAIGAATRPVLTRTDRWMSEHRTEQSSAAATPWT